MPTLSGSGYSHCHFKHWASKCGEEQEEGQMGGGGGGKSEKNLKQHQGAEVSGFGKC